MLIQLKAKNFKCFRDEVFLNFQAGSDNIVYDEDLTSHVRNIQDTSFTKGSIIFGANGSGKSALIQPLGYLKTFLQLPSNFWLHCHSLSFKDKKEDTSIEVTLFIEYIFYTYGFSFNKERITREYLFKFKANSSDSFNIFEKSWDTELNQYNTTGYNEQLTNFIKHTSIESFSSILSSYREDEEIKNIYSFLTSKIYEFKEVELNNSYIEVNNQLLIDSEFKHFCEDILSGIDLRGLYSTLNSSDETILLPSTGEKKIFALLYKFYQVFTCEDYVLILDEGIECLHPKILKKIISYLLCEGRGQLILVSNNLHLFDINLFKVEEIWLVDKFSDGHSELSNLYQFRKTVKEIISKRYSLEKAYFKGRFGGIPYC